MTDLFLDSAIRFWVFLPLVIITFLFGVIKNYVTILFTNEKKPDPQQVTDSHALIRSRLLRENGHFLTRQAFSMRKYYFNDKDSGFFKTQKRDTPMKSPMTDPTMMTEMLKGNVLNVFPMLIIGGWINWAFSGFLTTKVPFPLTYRFKPMLQRGCETLVSLDASWVSSASWYFLNIFGLRSMYGLFLGQDNSADHAGRLAQDPISAGMLAAPPDPQKAFKAEWEALELVDYKWALEDVESKLVDQQTQQQETAPASSG